MDAAFSSLYSPQAMRDKGNVRKVLKNGLKGFQDEFIRIPHADPIVKQWGSPFGQSLTRTGWQGTGLNPFGSWNYVPGNHVANTRNLDAAELLREGRERIEAPEEIEVKEEPIYREYDLPVSGHKRVRSEGSIRESSIHAGPNIFGLKSIKRLKGEPELPELAEKAASLPEAPRRSARASKPPLRLGEKIVKPRPKKAPSYRELNFSESPRGGKGGKK